MPVDLCWPSRYICIYTSKLFIQVLYGGTLLNVELVMKQTFHINVTLWIGCKVM